ncbi:M20/M25/M40 family metallo-hydrolase [Natranaerobius thermophilus]|uniref:Peptidase dimerisation domain protein n=1 Tax=Natranaerobius thermophilus (strain ATCC BAA-1301 / DSM 18059 / JW/NM-WN-LF) TaxID=457570 RepID=B2A0S8_NATTJ|nr:M20/M25/M40 family metallo-hydrolase [Natranaerobius thermophilus]ACB85958.1 peptidase dimerisation domain protein [Natranaerobius thermophilus JW/NM-WN-LF]
MIDFELYKILQNKNVARALKFIEKDAKRTLEEQTQLCEIPAPTFEEEKRGKYYYQLMSQLGLDEVKIDEYNNVIGILKGRQEQPGIITMAHLDTVFPQETDVSVKNIDGILYAPGISDNCRNLAAQLSIIRAFKEAGIRPETDIIFVGNVCEEGLGDLKGSKVIMESYPQVQGVVALDGTGMGTGSIVYGATGSKRYEVTFMGPGGHSFGAFGEPSAIHALGRAISKISSLEVPQEPKTTFNVGTISGGTSVNTIAAEASMLVDLRSNGEQELADLEREVLEIIQKSKEEENARIKKDDQENQLKVENKLVGDRPAGMQDPNILIVRAAVAATSALEIEPRLTGAGSTDANIPISMGIPAVCLSGGGQGGSAHTLEEWFDPTNAHIGVQRVFLLLVYLSNAT